MADEQTFYVVGVGPDAGPVYFAEDGHTGPGKVVGRVHDAKPFKTLPDAQYTAQVYARRISMYEEADWRVFKVETRTTVRPV